MIVLVKVCKKEFYKTQILLERGFYQQKNSDKHISNGTNRHRHTRVGLTSLQSGQFTTLAVVNPQDRKQLNCLTVFFFKVNLLFDKHLKLYIQYSYLLRHVKTGYLKRSQKWFCNCQWWNIQKLFYFPICIFPNNMGHEITKEFWKNSHFDSWFPS